VTLEAIHPPRRRALLPDLARPSAEPPIRLTSLSSCAGCAAKLGQALLRELVHGLPRQRDARLLVGTDIADDAGVFQLDDKRALVQTLDFFTPIVDDPFDFGQIAASNAFSDVYAMGGTPLTAMNIVGIPTDKLPPRVFARILAGGARKAREANALLVGGHTIKSPEPIYGMSVTGIAHPKQLLTNASAQPGDILILTKPLGTGIATTALKRNLVSQRLLKKAIRSMTHLNKIGATLAQNKLIKAATDITGFGLMGHLASLCKASHVGAELAFDQLPILDKNILPLIHADCIPGGTRTNLATAEELADWPTIPNDHRILLCDAQTSGGLLLCVNPKQLSKVLQLLMAHRTLARAVIGRIVKTPKHRIRVH
jgi:selenide,water dikinase